MNILGFEFKKVGKFYLDSPRNGKKGSVRASICLDAKYPKYREADETVYLILSGDKKMYVGEFSYNLEDRWLWKKGNYIDHHKSDEIEESLKRGEEITLWLAISPYYKVEKGFEMNLSKSIEHEILRNFDLPWNKRNKIKQWEEWRKNNCTKVRDIIK